MKKITINKKDYPCRVTMGAMLKFKRQQGYDVSQLKNDDIEGLVAFMFCCVQSASNADKVKFEMSFEEFCDNLTPDELAAFSNQENEQKKT